MAVNMETAHIIHLLSGIKENEYPKQLYYDKMIEKLIEKGHSKELAKRALQKNSKITVDAADKWIKQNKEWLEADIKAKQEQKQKLLNQLQLVPTKKVVLLSRMMIMMMIMLLMMKKMNINMYQNMIF